jgi:hypothetical protein
MAPFGVIAMPNGPFGTVMALSSLGVPELKAIGVTSLPLAT